MRFVSEKLNDSKKNVYVEPIGFLSFLIRKHRYFLGGLVFFLLHSVTLSSSPVGTCKDAFLLTKECALLRAEIKGDPKQDPCNSLISSYSKGRKDADQLFKIAYCMEHMAPPSRDSSYVNNLQPKLPGDAIWYLTKLVQLRQQREFSSMMLWVNLANLSGLSDENLMLAIAESYAAAGKLDLASQQYLRSLALHPHLEKLVEVQLENILRSPQATEGAKILLDKLSAYAKLLEGQGNASNPARAKELTSGSLVIHAVLESLAMQLNYMASVYHHYQKQNETRSLSPKEHLKRIQFFFINGYIGWARLSLEHSGFSFWPKRERQTAIRYYVELLEKDADWMQIEKVASESQIDDFTTAQSLIIAEALLHRGKARACLKQLDGITKLSETQRGKSVSLRARAEFLFTTESAGRKSRSEGDTSKQTSIQHLLEMEKNRSNRQYSSGNILFWQALAYLWQDSDWTLNPEKSHQIYRSADSLLVLASAYEESPYSQRAIRYRFWISMDSSEDRQNFFRGLEESPWSDSLKVEALNSLDTASGLWPQAEYEKAILLNALDAAGKAEEMLKGLIQSQMDASVALKAQIVLARWKERKGQSKTALATYEHLLLEYQQGVESEYARYRIQTLRQP